MRLAVLVLGMAAFLSLSFTAASTPEASCAATRSKGGSMIELDKIPDLAREMAEQVRERSAPVPRVESPADRDIALLFEMQAISSQRIVDLSAALDDLRREQGRGK